MDINDHRVLGQRLDLFSISEGVGQGLVLWHPNGATVRRMIRDFWEEVHLENGYQLVKSPHIAKGELWSTSGHLDYYAENMYVFEKEGQIYVVKPMNCPFHIEIYKSRPRSYRELPIRYAEWGTVYRYERSGTLHGLMRARGFTQDDAHIFCTAEQLDDEIARLLELTERVLRAMGFSAKSFELSTREPTQPDRYMGADEDWEWAQASLATALEVQGVDFEEMTGEAAFYGPKIDIKIIDASGREWQCSTIQFDFNLPKRFNLSYVAADGEYHRPFMIHRVILGSIERFFGILVEHYSGNLPTWLAPLQVMVIPINASHLKYARQVKERLSSQRIRVDLDSNASTLGYRIRDAETKKIPYIVICGWREEENNNISVRKHREGDLGFKTLEELVEIIEKERPRVREG